MITEERFKQLETLLENKKTDEPITTPAVVSAQSALREAFSLTPEIEALRTTERTAQDAHAERERQLQEEHRHQISQSETDIKGLSDAESQARAKLDDVACDQLKRPPLHGETEEEMARGFLVALADDTAAHYGVPVRGERYVETGGVLPPFDHAKVEPFTQQTTPLPKDQPINVIMLSIDTVAGLVLGIGLMALLGLIRERTFFLTPWPALSALFIGMSITVVASIVIRLSSVETARSKRRGEQYWGRWLPIPVALAMIAVEAMGVTKILEQQAIRRQLEGLSDRTPLWIVPFIACLLSGLVVLGAVLSANQRNRAEADHEEAVANEKHEYQLRIARLAQAHSVEQHNLARLRQLVSAFVDGNRNRYDDMMRYARELIDARVKRIAAEHRLAQLRAFAPEPAPFHSPVASRITELESRQLGLLQQVEAVLGPA